MLILSLLRILRNTRVSPPDVILLNSAISRFFLKLLNLSCFLASFISIASCGNQDIGYCRDNGNNDFYGFILHASPPALKWWIVIDCFRTCSIFKPSSVCFNELQSIAKNLKSCVILIILVCPLVLIEGAGDCDPGSFVEIFGR